MRGSAVLPMIVLLSAGYAAAQGVALEELADVPPPPPPMQSGEELEPEITIVRRDDATVQEYRVNGKLYMVQIKPAAGPSYYLIDQDGDGQLESRFNNVYNPVAVPNWVIFSWD